MRRIVSLIALAAGPSIAHADTAAPASAPPLSPSGSPTPCACTAPRYPLEPALRPLALPQGMVELGFRAGHTYLRDDADRSVGNIDLTVGLPGHWQLGLEADTARRDEGGWESSYRLSASVEAYSRHGLSLAPGLSARIDGGLHADGGNLRDVSVDGRFRVYRPTSTIPAPRFLFLWAKAMAVELGERLLTVGVRDSSAALDLRTSVTWQWDRVAMRFGTDGFHVPLYGESGSLGRSNLFFEELIVPVTSSIDLSVSHSTDIGDDRTVLLSQYLAGITVRHW